MGSTTSAKIYNKQEKACSSKTKTKFTLATRQVMHINFRLPNIGLIMILKAERANPWYGVPLQVKISFFVVYFDYS